MNRESKNDLPDFNFDKKVVCITGANGFIGRTLVENLIKKGGRIKILTRQKNQKFSTKVETFLGDLTDSNCAFEGFLKDADILVHCAGETKNEKKMSALHIDGTQALILAVKNEISRSEKIFHWIQLSSCGAYGQPMKCNIENFREILETTETAPNNMYEITKTRSDELVVAASNSSLFYTILRPSNVIGPSMKPNSFHLLIRLIGSGFFFHIGKKDAIATYVHVDDVVKAIVLIATNPKSRNQIYNISSDCKWVDLVKEIAVAMNKNILPFRVSYKLISPFFLFIKFVFGKVVHVPQISSFAFRTTYPTLKIESQLGYKFSKKIPESVQVLLKELAYFNK